MALDDLPVFAAGKCFLLRGSTVGEMIDTLRTHRPLGTVGGGVLVVEISAGGTPVMADPNGDGGGGGGSDSLEDLANLDDTKLYFLQPATKKRLTEVIAGNHTLAVQNGGIAIVTDGTDGVTLDTE